MRKRYPGKFEGCGDDRLAETLYSISQDGGIDDGCGESRTTGWFGLIVHRNHAYIVSEDSQGFFYYDYHESVEKAREAFERIQEDVAEDEGPQEEDICIESNGFQYSVGIVNGKHIGTFTDWDEAVNAVREWMKANQFWPNVWSVSCHGNANIISIDMEE